MPSTEERLATLEVLVSQLQADRDALAARLGTLEQTAGQGLADLGQAMEELRSRRPPVRRQVQELEARLEAAGIPPAPADLAPATEGGTP